MATDPTKHCTVDGCDRPAILRMNICWAHYRRQKRGAKIEGPVRGYATGQILLPGPHLAPRVVEMLDRAAKKHPAPNGEPSRYEVQRRVAHEWLERLMANKVPWLAGLQALESPVTSETGYISAAKVPVSPDENAYFEQALTQTGMTSHAMLIAIMDDWYYYWLDHVRQPRGAESTSPYGE